MRKRGQLKVLAMGLALCAGAASMPTPAAWGSDDAAPTTAEAPARRPLMEMLDRAGAAKGLDDLNINIFGHVESSFTYNVQGIHNNATRVFDVESEEFDLNQVDVTFERTVDPSKGKFDVGARVEWIYGKDADFIHSNGLFDWYNGPESPEDQFDLTQCYVDFAIPIGKGLDLKVGKFVTVMGYETINPTTNPLYSHSYLFGYAIPFTHTGVLATYAFNDQFTLQAGVTRGWEQALKDNNHAADVITNAIWKASDKLTLTFVNCVGPEQAGNSSDYREMFDFLAAYTATEKLTLALDADFGFESDSAAAGGKDAYWYGAAGYATQKLCDAASVTGRLEWFDDTDGARGLGTNVYEATVGVTITPFYKDKIMSNLKLRPEVRWDYAQKALFDGGSEHNQFTAAIEGYFTF